MKKRVLSLLVALCLIISLLPMTALAAPASVGFHFRTSGLNTGWVDGGNSTLNVVVEAGKAAYFTTAQSDPANSDNYYLVAGASEDNYNVKFAYADGVATIYLKNATISNSYGIFYGFSGAVQEAPLNVVVEADSSITTTGQMPALNLFSTGDVTITGPGKLDIVCDGKIDTWGAITVMNNVILDEANISMNLVDGPSYSQGISGISSLAGGDIIIDDSQLTITGIATITGTAGTYAFYGSTKDENVTDLTIRNGSKVQVAASVKDNWNVSPAAAQLICVPGTVTVSYSDFEIAGVGTGNTMVIFRTPTELVIEGCTATWENNGNWPGYAKYDAATGTITPPAATYLKDTIPTASDLSGKAYLKTVHVCVEASEPNYLDSDAPCSSEKIAVYSCVYCDVEMRRNTEIKPSDVPHTPNDETFEVGQNGSATSTGVTNGYYETKTTCSVCGETIGEVQTTPFAPAPFYYYTSGATEANFIGAGTPTKVLNPGDVYYYTTTNSDVDNPDKYYMTATDDTENWNVKLEYPMGGTPTMTLKGATIKNGAGIWYGFHNAANQTSAPLNIIVASDSTIEVTGAPTANSSVSGNTSGALNLCTTGDVTVSGTGLLTLKSNASSGGINVKGNLNLNDANVAIYDIDQYEKGNLILAGGNVTVSGGTLYGNAYTTASGWPTGRVKSLVNAANLTIQDGADVTLFGSAFESYNAGYSAFTVSGEIAISDSEVVFASNGGACDNLFSKAPNLDGLTAGKYNIVASAGKAGYNAETDILSAPSNAKAYDPAAFESYLYFAITHICVAGEPTYENATDFACSSQKYEILTCTVCYEQISKELVNKPSDVDHTPGDEVTEVGQNGDANVDGYYQTNTMCSVCGEVAAVGAQTAFEPARFAIANVGNVVNANINLVVNPGETKYFTTTADVLYSGTSAEDYPGSCVLTASDESNWSLMIEYPMGGTPKMTMKDLTLVNSTGIRFFGTNNLEIVVVGDNYLNTAMNYASSGANNYNIVGTINSASTGTVTISGTGKLTLENIGKNVACINTAGNLVLDNVNIATVDTIAGDTKTYGIRSSGNVTISGGSLNISGYTDNEGHPYGQLANAIVATGDLTIQDGANVTAIATICNNADNTPAFAIGGKFTITDSYVEFANCGGYTGKLFAAEGPELNLDEDNFVASASTNPGTYNAELDEFIAPATVDFNAENAASYLYFKIGKAPAKLEASVTVGNTLTNNFRIPAADIEAEEVYAMINGVTSDDALTAEGGYYTFAYTDIAAKQMGDTFKVQLVDGEGNALTAEKEDSILAYALRGLATPEDHPDFTREVKTLLVDMLIYGAAAQVEFGYNTDALVTAGLDEYIEEYASAEPTYPADNNAEASGDGYFASSLKLESNISMFVGAYTDVVGEGAYALVTFTNYKGTVINDGTGDDDKAVVEAEQSTEDVVVFSYNKLVAADGACDVKWDIYNAEGQLMFTVTDSVARYCGRADAEGYAIADALMNYTASAYACLG